MQKNLIEQFSLPGYVKGKSFGEAAKAIQAKFKDRNDSVSLNTKEELLGSLQQAQEYVKMQQALKNESQEIPDQMDGQVPDGMEEFAAGGFMDQSKDAFGSQEGGIAGGALGAAGDIMNIGKDLFGDTGVDTMGTQHTETRDVGMETANKALSGAAKGMKIGGPLGAAIFGGVSGIAGLIGAKRANKDINVANNNFVQGQSANARQTDFAYGGPIKPIASTVGTVNPADVGKNPLTKTPMAPELTLGQKLKAGAMQAGEWVGDKAPVAAKWAGENAGNIAQYSSVLGNALALKNLKRGTTERGSRLDNTYTKQQYDKAALINQANQNDTAGALTEASGGDAGGLRSSLLANDINQQKMISKGMEYADNVNRQEGIKKHQFDLQRDRTNVMLDQQFLDNKAKDEAAYQTTRANLKKSLFEDASAIGREEVDKKIVKEIFGYKYDGKYVKDPQGEVVKNEDGTPMTKEQLEAKKKEAKAKK